jgi:hypothetical protein
MLLFVVELGGRIRENGGRGEMRVVGQVINKMLLTALQMKFTDELVSSVILSV